MRGKKVAGLVYVRNYPKFFKQWLDYYSQFNFDLFVVNLSDGQDDIKYNWHLFKEVKKVEIGNLEDLDYHDMCVGSIEYMRAKLLKVYDYIVYTDLDELVIVNPELYKDLEDYVNQLYKEEVICTGKEIIEYPDEAPFDWDKLVLAQRKYWWDHTAHSKPAISRIKQGMVWGFHYTKKTQKEALNHSLGLKQYINKIADPNLIMVHTRLIDSKEFERLKGKREGKISYNVFVRERVPKCKKIPNKYRRMF
jgi:hypothetical protein